MYSVKLNMCNLIAKKGYAQNNIPYIKSFFQMIPWLYSMHPHYMTNKRGCTHLYISDFVFNPVLQRQTSFLWMFLEVRVSNIAFSPCVTQAKTIRQIFKCLNVRDYWQMNYL